MKETMYAEHAQRVVPVSIQLIVHIVDSLKVYKCIK